MPNWRELLCSPIRLPYDASSIFRLVFLSFIFFVSITTANVNAATWSERHQRAFQLALENQTFHDEITSLILDVYGAGLGDFAEIEVAVYNELKRNQDAFIYGMSPTDMVSAVADLIEVVLTGYRPHYALPLDVIKIATSFVTAYVWHMFFDPYISLPQLVSGQTNYKYPAFYDQQRVSSQFTLVNEQQAQAIVERYGTIPGGIVLEGDGEGLGQLRSVRYIKEFNAFIMDEEYSYLVPVPASELASIFGAIQEQDEIAVSWGQKLEVIGALHGEGAVIRNMFLADGFLAEFIAGRRAWTEYYKPAGGYQRREPKHARGVGFYVFIFTNSGFHAAGTRVSSDGLSVTITVIPVKKTRYGAYEVNLGEIRRAQLSPEIGENAQHFADNFDHYRKERLVRAVLAYAEVADFGRLLKRLGVDLGEVLQGETQVK